jgi:cytidylate kinase
MTNLNNTVPVIAVDGPSASGKGSVAEKVADCLGYHYLDSGAIYRILAFAAYKAGVDWSDEQSLAELASRLNIDFKQSEVFLDGDRVSEAIRSEAMGRGASEVAVHPAVRAALLQLQQNFRQSPGLVADGRDMASVVFPDAKLKIFLTASTETRAKRRHLQLLNRGLSADYQAILDDLTQRDLRDSQRTTAPLKQMPEALLLDTTARSIQEAVDFILNAYQKVA